jgi:hypothetical protein
MASCGMVRLLAASCSTFSLGDTRSPEPEPRWRDTIRRGRRDQSPDRFASVRSIGLLSTMCVSPYQRVQSVQRFRRVAAASFVRK